ncbi:hypothetical protein ACWPXL_10005 [Lactiplantibacillus plantarum]
MTIKLIATDMDGTFLMIMVIMTRSGLPTTMRRYSSAVFSL